MMHEMNHRILAVLPVVLLAAGCVSESDVRTQVDQAKAELRTELTAAKTESAGRADKLGADLAATRTSIDKVGGELAALRTALAALEQKQAASEQFQRQVAVDVVALRSEVQRVSGDLTRSVQDLLRRVEASSSLMRDHLGRQRAALAEQLKSLDQIIAGADSGTQAPAAAPAAPTPAIAPAAPAPAVIPAAPAPAVVPAAPAAPATAVAPAK